MHAIGQYLASRWVIAVRYRNGVMSWIAFLEMSTYMTLGKSFKTAQSINFISFIAREYISSAIG